MKFFIIATIILSALYSYADNNEVITLDISANFTNHILAVTAYEVSKGNYELPSIERADQACRAEGFGPAFDYELGWLQDPSYTILFTEDGRPARVKSMSIETSYNLLFKQINPYAIFKKLRCYRF